MERRAGLAASGVLATGVTLGSVLLATMVSPTFQWSANALSELGDAGTTVGTEVTVLFFNGGLIVGGAIGLVFAWLLWRAGDPGGKRVVAALFGLTMVSMGAIGVFPIGSPLHFPVSAAFFVLVTVTIWVDAVVVVGPDEGDRGAIAAWLGAVNVAAWGIWALTGPIRRPGLAIPEIVGALVLSGWVLSTAIRLSQWEPVLNRSRAP